MFIVNGEVNENLLQLQNLPFKVVNSGFVYLGVCCQNIVVNLYRKTLLSLLPKIKKDFEQWSLLNLSISARITAIKMNIFTLFLYLFQCIPIFLSLSFFHKVESLILDFTWNKKTPRLHRQVLQRPKALGGVTKLPLLLMGNNH